jgi:hypothetical protein
MLSRKFPIRIGYGPEIKIGQRTYQEPRPITCAVEHIQTYIDLVPYGKKLCQEPYQDQYERHEI